MPRPSASRKWRSAGTDDSDACAELDPTVDVARSELRGWRPHDRRPCERRACSRPAHRDPGRQRRRQERLDAAHARVTEADFGRDRMARAGSGAFASPPGHGIPATGDAASLRARQCSVRIKARRVRGARARRPRGARGRGFVPAGASAGAGALRWRAAAPRTCARLVVAPRGAVPRRAHRQPRSHRKPRDRGRDRRSARGWNQGRDDDAQPRPGAPAGRRGPVHPPGAAGRARAGGAFLQATCFGRSRGLHKRRTTVGLITRILLVLMLALPAQAQDKFITVASTTSTEQSGLFKHLLPVFEKKTGIQVRVVALGTGQALDLGKRGDADVAFVHDKAAEEKLVAEGFFVDRREVMYNDFIIVGPKSDPAKAKGADVVAGLKHIAGAKAPFASRGDKSGTHAAELRLWKDAGIDPSQGKGGWYRETGSGMGPTLNTASGMNAYALTDRGTWLSFKNRGDLVIVVEGDKRLFNQYGVMLVNPSKHAHVKKAEGMAFINWVTSAEGQKVIADYKIGGEQLFFPNAKK